MTVKESVHMQSDWPDSHLYPFWSYVKVKYYVSCSVSSKFELQMEMPPTNLQTINNEQWTWSEFKTNIPACYH